MFRFTIPSMTCGACGRRVTSAILGVDPAADIVTDPPARTVGITTSASEAALVAALAEAGYPIERVDL